VFHAYNLSTVRTGPPRRRKNRSLSRSKRFVPVKHKLAFVTGATEPRH